MLVAIHYFCFNNSKPLNPKRIVITGGPGTGKSSVIHELELSGFHCYHELIRSMTLEAKKEGDPGSFVTNPLAFVSDPNHFNRQLLEGRLRHFGQASGLNLPVVFYDRGIPDVLAYMDYFRQDYNRDFETACRNNRYDKVLLLPPWEDIYVSDNERLESFEEALQIHQYLWATYERFGYTPVLIPEGTVRERTTRILHELTQAQYL
jgi:predicted ATPase